MVSKKFVSMVCLALILVSGCSRQQSDWQKTRETNTTDAYELFLKKYPSGEFTAQAEARVKELSEERDWRKARDADTSEAYQAFVKQYPDGKLTEEARIRIENFTLAQAPGSTPSTADGAPAADLPPRDGPAAEGPARTATPASPAPSASPARPAPASRPARVAVTPQSAPVLKRSAAANGAGQYGIQLGAFKTDRRAADKHWARLQKDYPRVLAGLSSTVLPKQTATGSWYRLQAIGLTEKHARSICSSLKAQSEACLVVRPTSG